MTNSLTYDISTILELIPHRYPFLLVDRVIALDPWKSIIAYKNITYNEPQFQGHFPSFPVMPGVLIVEAMGQAGVIFIALSRRLAGAKIPDGVNLPELEGRLAFFASCDKVKFRRPVIPGDRLNIEVKLLRLGSRIWKMAAQASVNGQKAAEAEMTSALPKKI
ncbi:MAG: 3-hydroxyacyl-[acyl-carrier-protein] dehydratase FabZ [Candidatus Adiutrix intracellularis]|jgi:beta-hydroxyacyl-ACP dehydratase FabZ|nr:MAG: 3-hydroxyacyl-[acyl-carrier-protein] dehydratase FabZ [Candidatus Adiutrix intracellularis]MDR2827496.1 3-hydroxyacyl-ACP dehydratase FabZ [Candidatus Adiutrix intracellularis]